MGLAVLECHNLEAHRLVAMGTRVNWNTSVLTSPVALTLRRSSCCQKLIRYNATAQTSRRNARLKRGRPLQLHAWSVLCTGHPDIGQGKIVTGTSFNPQRYFSMRYRWICLVIHAPTDLHLDGPDADEIGPGQVLVRARVVFVVAPAWQAQ